jgi:hypothetical protein
MLPGKLSRFQGASRIGNAIWNDHRQSSLGRHFAQPVAHATETGSQSVRHIEALWRNLGMQLERPPGNIHVIFFFQLLDPNLANVAPRSKEI